MIVPEYWAEAKLRRHLDERQVTVKRFGWSDTSQAEAQAHAEARAAEAMARIASGEAVRRTERKQAYGGGDGLPIREEIVARHGDVVITRNGYGALCLNTPDVLFADVDFEEGPGARIFFGVLLFHLGLVGLAGFFLGGLWLVVVGCVAAFSLAPVTAAVVFKVYELLTGGAEARARARIHRFVDTHPDWRLRVYRTPAGFRVLAMHQPFDPKGEGAGALLEALHSDPIYIQMCRNQNCFRARVSPKPWRIGIDRPMRPRPGVWPITPGRMPERLAWIAGYEEAARGFASCRFEEELGGGARDYRVEQVQRLHDDYGGAELGLPIA